MIDQAAPIATSRAAPKPLTCRIGPGATADGVITVASDEVEAAAERARSRDANVPLGEHVVERVGEIVAS